MAPEFYLIFILVYFCILLLISYFTSRGADSESFFVGNRKSKWWVVSFGMIGTSISGVTFISVPGWVKTTDFSYMQMILGNVVGYITIAFVLLPVYYRLHLTSIYTYLEQRFGRLSYKTGASFFLISRSIGAAFRLFLVANVLQIMIFDTWSIPFPVTVLITLGLIWLYTYKGGVKTIIWTDTLQTVFLLFSLGASIYIIAQQLHMNVGEMVQVVSASKYSHVFEFSDWHSKSFFFKQFVSGAFIAIVMTGLDQDMMQKNLSCKNLKEARKNMLWYGCAFIPVNLLFLSLGALLLLFAEQKGIALPALTDDIYPMLATKYLGSMVSIFFILGLMAAAYASADGALTSLTTSFTVDILGAHKKEEKQLKRTKTQVHLMFSLLLAVIIILFRVVNDQNVISAIFTAAGYTYGPLLGLYSFGLFTKYGVRDRLVPYIAVGSPIVCYLLNMLTSAYCNYSFGFEILILNGLLCFVGLFFIRTTSQELE